jgi:hypothetical protein
MCNLYIVFVSGAGAQDVVTKVVILDFVLMQQTLFKREILMGTTGLITLDAIKFAYESNPFGFSAPLRRRNDGIRLVFGGLLLLLGQLPIFLSLAFTIFGPICKPGIDTIAVLNIKTKGN